LEKLDCAEATTRRREGMMRMRLMGTVREEADKVRRVAMAAAGGSRGAVGAMAIPPWTAMANFRDAVRW
jgi:predicted PP-loop superfamily ATPase